MLLIPLWTVVQSSEISTFYIIFRGSGAHQKSAWSLFVYLYLPWTHRDRKSASERLALQPKETNVSAFCSWCRHILTCRSHYITRWKWPEMHVRMNQFAAQPLVQLISWVGVVSAVHSLLSTGSQRSSKCWNQLSRTCHLSLSNGKSICVGYTAIPLGQTSRWPNGKEKEQKDR